MSGGGNQRERLANAGQPSEALIDCDREVTDGAVSLRVTRRAGALLQALRREYGEGLLFVISGGCCDATSPMLLKDFRLGLGDRRIGDVQGIPVYASEDQARRLGGYELELDVIDGVSGHGFSLEGAYRKRFVLRSHRRVEG